MDPLNDRWLGARPIFWIVAGLAGVALAVYKGKDKLMVPLNRAQWIRHLAAVFDEVVPAMGEPYKSSIGKMQQAILISQAGHESGFGSSRLAREGHNFWNLTAGSKWTGGTITSADLEYGKSGGQPKKITSAFRKYASDKEGIADMLRFIGPGTRYTTAWENLIAGKRDGYLAALREAGFFTQPIDLYTKAVSQSMASVISALTGGDRNV